MDQQLFVGTRFIHEHHRSTSLIKAGLLQHSPCSTDQYDLYANQNRFFYAVSYFPRQNIEFALTYAILMVGASKNLCIGGNINPKVRVGSVFTKKYPHYAYAEFEVIDLFELLLRALTSPDGQGGTS